MNVIQLGLSKSHRACTYIHTYTLTMCFDVPPRHTYMLISSSNPSSLTYKQAAKPTQFIPLMQMTQYPIKQ